MPTRSLLTGNFGLMWHGCPMSLIILEEPVIVSENILFRKIAKDWACGSVNNLSRQVMECSLEQPFCFMFFAPIIKRLVDECKIKEREGIVSRAASSRLWGGAVLPTPSTSGVTSVAPDPWMGLLRSARGSSCRAACPLVTFFHRMWEEADEVSQGALWVDRFNSQKVAVCPLPPGSQVMGAGSLPWRDSWTLRVLELAALGHMPCLGGSLESWQDGVGPGTHCLLPCWNKIKEVLT